MKYKVNKTKIKEQYGTITNFCKQKEITHGNFYGFYKDGYTFSTAIQKELGSVIEENQQVRYKTELLELRKKIISELN